MGGERRGVQHAHEQLFPTSYNPSFSQPGLYQKFVNAEIMVVYKILVCICCIILCISIVCVLHHIHRPVKT
jgi:hypothetical protein